MTWPIPNKGASLLFAFLMVMLFSLIVFDSSQHFDAALIERKKKAHSAQKHWNIHYGQSYVYLNGGIRHNDDFKKLESVLEPGTAVITDVATSYYMASSLPIYVKNIHRHHGRAASPVWERLISHRVVCYIDAPENLQKFWRVMSLEPTRSKKKGVPAVAYVAVNRTHYNDNFKRGCIGQRRRGMLSVINQLGAEVFDGESIKVYKLATTAP